MTPDNAAQASPRQHYLAACAEGRLVYQHGEGEGVIFPPRLPETGRDGLLAWRDSSGMGKVYSMTVIHPRNEEPYVLALVDLDEGFRMMSRIDTPDPEVVQIGQRVEVRFRKLEDDGPELPVFAPVENAA